MVDSLMSQAIDEGLKNRQLPTLQFLIENGQYYSQMVSSFPTMSVSLDSTFLTGTYPDRHHIPGLIWYSIEDKEIINCGTGPLENLKNGVNSVLWQALVNLNQHHLNKDTPTIYEELSNQGISSGSINGLVYRGKTDHTLSIPAWLYGPTSLPKTIKVKGPDWLSFGAFSNPIKDLKDLPVGLINKIGFNTKYSMETVKYLVESKNLPNFLLAYLPDLDKKMHKEGPPKLDEVKKIDHEILLLLNSFGSPEKAITEVTFIIMGDSGQTKILPSKEDPVIELHTKLKDFNILRLGTSASKETEIILAVNERMAYVYTLKPSLTLNDLVGILDDDTRIDLIAWKDNEWIHVVQGGTSNKMSFKSEGEFKDNYNQSWSIEGNVRVLDLTIDDESETVTYGDYPDALRRLTGALYSHMGQFLVVSAKPGYELAAESSPTHVNGGGHGSLHKTDSLVPLIITGTNQKPEHLRIVDMKSYLLKLLNTQDN